MTPVFKRAFYTHAAGIALFIGVLGLIIPIIPGILFLALALMLFANASRRFRARLHESARTRPYILRWEASDSLGAIERLQLAGLLLYAVAADSLTAGSRRA